MTSHNPPLPERLYAMECRELQGAGGTEKKQNSLRCIMLKPSFRNLAVNAYSI